MRTDHDDESESDHEVPAVERAPGRFVARHEYRMARRRPGLAGRLARAIRVVTGIALVLIALLIGWLPGPGFIPLALAGTVLLAGEIRWVAERLDPIEQRLRARVPMRRRARAALAIVGTASVAIPAVLVTIWLVRDEPASPATLPTPPHDVGARPAEGTYTYRGGGMERIDVGAGIERALPRQIEMHVERRDGCAWSAEYRYSRERSMQDIMCSTTSGVLQLRTSARISIGPLDQMQHIDCDPQTAFRTRQDAQSEWRFSCAADATKVTIRARRLDTTACPAGAHAVELDATFTGSQRGTARYGYILDHLGLPLELTTEIAADLRVGLIPVTYEAHERYRRSDTPATVRFRIEPMTAIDQPQQASRQWTPNRSDARQSAGGSGPHR